MSEIRKKELSKFLYNLILKDILFFTYFVEFKKSDM